MLAVDPLCLSFPSSPLSATDENYNKAGRYQQEVLVKCHLVQGDSEP